MKMTKIKLDFLALTRREIILIVVSIALSFVMSGILYWRASPQRVVQFDIKGTIDLFANELVQSNLTDQQKEQKSAVFSKALQKATTQYAKDKNVIILTAPAVISGARDDTKEVQALTLELMKGPSQ